MRKKNQVQVLCKDSADVVAARIKRGCGLDKAKSIASTLAKNLNAMGPEDVNSMVTTLEGLKKQRNFWTQVSNILHKQKA